MWGINSQGFLLLNSKIWSILGKVHAKNHVGYQFTGLFVAEFKNMVHFRQSAFLLIDKVRKVHRENHGGYQFTGFFVAEYKNMVHFRQSAFLLNDIVCKVHAQFTWFFCKKGVKIDKVHKKPDKVHKKCLFFCINSM